VVQKLSGLLGVYFNEVLNEFTQYEEKKGPYGPLEGQNIFQWCRKDYDNALIIIAKCIVSL
jgi:hypothetical protein